MFFLIHIYSMSLVAVNMKKCERAKQNTITKDKHKAAQEEVSFLVWGIWKGFMEEVACKLVLRQGKLCWEKPARDSSQQRGQLCQRKEGNENDHVWSTHTEHRLLYEFFQAVRLLYRWGSWGSGSSVNGQKATQLVIDRTKLKLHVFLTPEFFLWL